MNSHRPPRYPEQSIVALFGKRVQLKNIIGNMILGSENYFTTQSDNFVVEKNNSFKIINTPDFFDEESLHPDQDIIDFMALSYPGPNLFILAVDSEHCQEEEVVAQISKLQDLFGESVAAHLVVMLPDIERFRSLSHLKERFKARLAIANENLATECKKWCSGLHSFLYDYKNYSQEVVMRRRKALEKRRVTGDRSRRQSQQILDEAGYTRPDTPSTGAEPKPKSPTVSHKTISMRGNSADEVLDNIFNVVLLGLTGTGKSASANTILTAGNPNPGSVQLFKSEPSSMPVTMHCEVRITEQPFGVKVRLVDTPDFFHDEVKNSQAQVEMCKKFCRQGRCVVLLVLQLGRITDVETGIIEKLEKKLGWKIRESTIVLLTHGEDLKGSLEKFINASGALKNIVEMCNNRCHLLNNYSKDTKQVTELIKKIPNCKEMFPKFKNNSSCCIC